MRCCTTPIRVCGAAVLRSLSMARTPFLERSMLSLAALVLAVSAWAEAPTVVLTLPSEKTLQVEVLTTDAERQMGLMFRESLPQDRGMLFVFDESDFYGFWMKNCKFAIDIVWLDEKRRVVHMAERVPPCRHDPCPSYQPLQRARYVVEMNAGQARREKVVIGAKVEFKLPR
jgi:uncharacterized membrane protein (UPF0127 family)